ncbi:chorismate-binding protein [Mycobacterium sp. 050272]|uniref:chorismate-binding protein n=1 Tax=Mycobacterium sp. 050272 TaxID=3142488 RepID=UPI00319374C0
MTLELATVTATPPADPAVTVQRRALPGTIAPTEALTRLRGRRRLVGLLGAWAGGGALIACDPVAHADDLDDLTMPTLSTADGVLGAGWFGVLGYQYGTSLEVLPPAPDRPSPRPQCDFAYYDHLLRYETATGTWWFESAAVDERAEQIERAYHGFARILAAADGPAAQPYTCSAFAMRPTPDAHRLAIAKALEAIRAGDIFQTNLAVRLQADFHGDPIDVFVRGVEELKPAYAAYVTSVTGAVASFSPELFLQRIGTTVRTSPIKGTAPLRARPEDLLSSAKDNAENTMIVDLMRNDLGRVSVPGSVTVPRRTRVEQHTGVWHLLTDVVANLRDGISDTDLVRATFPPGSVTGAPKVRAMELINELEDSGREAYTGAIGVISCTLMELNVVIRTLEFSDDSVWLGVGGGIVADSTPDGELRECLAKAQPLLHAIGGTLAVDVDESERRDTGGADAVISLPGAAGEFPLFVVDDSGVRFDAHYARRPVLGPVAGVLATLRRSGIGVDEATLTRDDLNRGAEAFVVKPDATIVSVDAVMGGSSSHPGTLAGWLSRQKIRRGINSEATAITDTPLRHPRVRHANRDMRVLLIDNYDSFVFNLSQYCEELGAGTEVVRSDPERLHDIVAAAADGQFQRLIISPGPGTPRQAGMSMTVIRALAGVLPILGVCLGHQAIGEAFGARTIRAPRPVHGQATIVYHDSRGVYAGLPGPFTAARYHSLVIDEESLPTELAVTARTPSGLLMGVRHREFDIEGIQVHPESLLTPAGQEILSTFLSSPEAGVGARSVR